MIIPLALWFISETKAILQSLPERQYKQFKPKDFKLFRLDNLVIL